MSGGYINGCVTNGSYFTYRGVRYGMYTKVLFTEKFYEKVGESYENKRHVGPAISCGWKYPYFRTFDSIITENGKRVWRFGGRDLTVVNHKYLDIDPNKDIAKIIVPVYYYEPKELVKLRLSNGSWIIHVLPQTLIYMLCLIISPILQQWYLIWTLGLGIYLHICYIKLSKGCLNER